MKDAFEIVGDHRAQVGEGAFWDAKRRLLWWVDVFAPALLGTDPAQAAPAIIATAEMAGGAAVANDGRVLIAMETGVFAYDPAEPERPATFLSAPAELPNTHRFNDLTVDPRGRLIVGTMRKSALGHAPTGVLYSFAQGRWSILARGFTTINGLAFAPDGKSIYWSDSHPSVNRVWTAEYDPASGSVGEVRDFIDTSRYRGRPDGAAMDCEGGYWLAAVGGGCLHRFNSDGRLDRTLDLPVEHPTKPAFGGAGLDSLFVTSLSIRPSETHAVRFAGALVRLAAPIPGMVVPPVALTASS